MTDHFYSFVRVPVPVCLRVISVTSTVIISMSLEYNQQYMVIVFSSTLYCVILIAKDNLKMAALDLTMQPAAWTQNIALIVLPASWVWCSGTRLCEITVLQRWALWITVVLWKHVHGWKKKCCESLKHATLTSLVNVYITPLQSIGMPMSTFINAGAQLPLEVSS